MLDDLKQSSEMSFVLLLLLKDDSIFVEFTGSLATSITTYYTYSPI